MTPRSGLYVALVGLVMAVVCLATLFLLRDLHDPEVNSAGDLMIFGMAIGLLLLLDLGALLGLILLVMGLVFAVKNQSVKPS